MRKTLWMSALVPCWVPVFTAFEALQKQYEASNYYANEETCWRAASDALLRRLRLGQLPSRASLLTEEWDYSFDFEPEPEPAMPPHYDADGMLLVPKSFWEGFATSVPIRREIDWLAGDFQFMLEGNRSGWGQNGTGTVIGLEVDANFLPQLSKLLLSPKKEAEPASFSRPRGGGRPPASWWPDFAEELAIYIHENGIPDGEGHDGQSTIIDAVFARMNVNNKTEPGRGTVQPVVNAILRRLRSAEN
ncbi:hypothetical protein GRI97_03170 [Altererythrobacter xixiisoli]|uniref:Uncharacterized protein n=1 Tax=Croceibacterium xixiisoli TaxID=1476466 RepID=A0A6I4TRQ6_9SPHN|nr:hypothetical protein [Croceibacterium xixiisoli]MXO97989.1 hypothetical protein [Croceibacterium xixiisoli]